MLIISSNCSRAFRMEWPESSNPKTSERQTCSQNSGTCWKGIDCILNSSFLLTLKDDYAASKGLQGCAVLAKHIYSESRIDFLTIVED